MPSINIIINHIQTKYDMSMSHTTMKLKLFEAPLSLNSPSLEANPRSLGAGVQLRSIWGVLQALRGWNHAGAWRSDHRAEAPWFMVQLPGMGLDDGKIPPNSIKFPWFIMIGLSCCEPWNSEENGASQVGCGQSAQSHSTIWRAGIRHLRGLPGMYWGRFLARIEFHPAPW